MDEQRLSDEQIAWFIREYGRTPEHTVFKMAVEIQSLRAHLAYYADPAIWAYGSGVRDGQPVDLDPPVLRDDEGDRARAALNGDDA